MTNRTVCGMSCSELIISLQLIFEEEQRAIGVFGNEIFDISRSKKRIQTSCKTNSRLVSIDEHVEVIFSRLVKELVEKILQKILKRKIKCCGCRRRIIFVNVVNMEVIFI